MSTDMTNDIRAEDTTPLGAPEAAASTNSGRTGRRKPRKAEAAAATPAAEAELVTHTKAAEVEPVTKAERPAAPDAAVEPPAIASTSDRTGASRYAPIAAALLVAIGGSVAAAAYGAHVAREAIAGARATETEATQKLAKTLDDLTVRVEALTQAGRQPAAASDAASLKAVQASIDRVRQDLTGQIAALGTRVDEIDKANRELRERASVQGASSEKPMVIPAPAQAASADPAPEQTQSAQTDASRTAALSPPANVPLPPATTDRPVPAPEAPRDVPLRGWTILDVNRGVALIEGRGGVYEITRGSTLPAIGRVEAIERRGRGWVIVTSRGVIQGPGVFSSW